MPVINENILIESRDTHDLALQVIVDTLAYGTGLPLRVLNISHLSGLAPYQLELQNEVEKRNDKVSNTAASLEYIHKNISATKSPHASYLEDTYMPLEIAFDELPKPIKQLARKPNGENDFMVHQDTINLLDNIETHIWRTLSSHSMAINDLFRLSPEWRWFECLWLYSLKDQINGMTESKRSFTVQAYGIEGWSYRFERVDAVQDLILVVGPTYDPTFPRTTERFQKTYGQNILSYFAAFHHLFGRWGITRRFSHEDMERTLHTRTPLSETAVEERVGYASRTLSVIYDCYKSNVSLDDSNRRFSSRRFANRLTRNILGAQRLAIGAEWNSAVSLQLKRVRRRWSIAGRLNMGSTIAQEHNFNFKLPVWHSEGIQTYALLMFKTFIDENSGARRAAGDVTLTFVSEAIVERQATFEVEVDGVAIQESKILAELYAKLERWWETASARKRNMEAIRTRLASDWLNHQYLTSSTRIYESKKDDVDEEWYSRGIDYDVLCSILQETLRSDLCNIYRYYTYKNEGALKVMGMACKTSEWSHSELSSIAETMNLLSMDPDMSVSEKAEVSLVYKCAWLRNTEYYSQPTMEETGAEFMPNSSVLTWPSLVPKPGRVITTPIIVEGRIWGVIEIATRATDGLEMSSRFALNSFASLLGSYLFNITLTKSLQTMGTDSRKHSVHTSATARVIGDSLASSICRVCLARASTIFLQSETGDDGLYEIVGHAGQGYYSGEKRGIEVDMRDSKDCQLLVGLLWQRYMDTGVRNITARVAVEEEDTEIRDNPNFIVLGRGYKMNQSPASIINELVKDKIAQIHAFVFDIHEFGMGVRDTFGIPKEHDYEAHIQSPAGMVLIYHQHFKNRPHWYEVNEVISNRLAQTFDEIFVGRRRREDRGRLVRHELKHTVRALGTTGVKIQDDSKFLLKSFGKLTSVARKQQTGTDPTVAISSIYSTSQLQRIENTLKRLTKIVDNWQGVYDQLSSQTESIERIDELNAEALSKFLFPMKSKKPREIVQYANIMDSLRDALTNYSDVFKKRGLYLTYDYIPNDLYIRVQPEYIALLFRNILDNWSKYSTNTRALSVSLSPPYDTKLRPDKYVLQFSNSAHYTPATENIQNWFIFGERGDTLRKEVDGDGIGLFWIRYIMEVQNDIRVSLTTEKIGSEGKESMIYLDFTMKPYWLTRNPEISIEE